MKLTRNSKIYAVVGFATSLVFFYLLDKFVSKKEDAYILVLTLAYVLVWIVAGLLLGKKDSTRKYRGDLGMLYHWVATVATLAASLMAVAFLEALTLFDFAVGATVMAVSLVFHYFGVAGDNKGISKKEAFK